MATAAFDIGRQILTPTQVPFAELVSSFERAGAARRCHEFNLTVAGYPVRIRVVGDSWAQIVAASMGHLRRDDAAVTAPALTVDVWDAAETGVAAPPRAVSGASTPPILMKTSDDGCFVGEERPHGITWLDVAANRIIGVTHAVNRLNLDERARPFHKMLSAWLEERGVQFVHSGLITHAEKGVLFVGNGGAGKSTSSISCLRAGMGYLGDDFLGLSLENEGFIGHGLYASCLLNVQHIKRFPDLQPLGHAPNYDYEQKFVLYLTEAFPASLRKRASIDALVLPRVVDAEVTTFRPATKAATLMAIAPTSVMLLPRPNRAAFERLTQLVQNTSSYWLELGRRVDLIPTAVQALAEDL
ncbi:MAG: hypothetical protein ABSF96_16335 [Steroidobacteraceae bacterium]|jgi:hypothetical protein